MSRAHFTNNFIHPTEGSRTPCRIEGFVQLPDHLVEFQFQQDVPEEFQLFRVHAVNTLVQLGPELPGFYDGLTHGLNLPVFRWIARDFFWVNGDKGLPLATASTPATLPEHP